jgi:DNA recombination protein RmuC
VSQTLLWILLVLAALNLVGLVLVWLRSRGDRDDPTATLRPVLDSVEKAQERLERAFRDEAARSREESAALARQLREELAGGQKAANDTVRQQMVAIAEIQKGQLDSFGQRLAKLTETNEKQLESLRNTVDTRLKAIQEDNAKRLDQMRQTVDEKLQGTLEKRLGESFRLVSERLEQVHKGLGEMQTLAVGVGDLKKVLSNVKTRGTWGEVQLEALLTQVLTREQYDRNVATKEGSGERVEFAIRLPGRDAEQDVVWLPVDAKFPQADYQRLLDAQEAGDGPAAEQALRQLEQQVRHDARDIHDKYLNPPATTDFGMMFLPTEGLYAEVLRRPGLAETLQREYRVVVAGPTTLAALLNALQMGFQTLAIQQRSSEVWRLLAVVKREFGKFGEALDAVRKKLHQASKKIDAASRKSRTIERRLRDVQALPAEDAAAGALADDEDDGVVEQADSADAVRGEN